MKNNEQHAIDISVRQALENLEIPYNADHWQSMVDKLDALDAEDAAFDNQLAEKLAHVEIPFQAANWVDMSARLDDLDNSETAFDALLSHRFERLQATYQPDHWHLMAEKIEETFSWRAKIVRYKVVEVALVLLTLFTVGNMLDLPFDFSKENNIETSLEVTKKDKKERVKKAVPEKVKENKSFYPKDWRNRPVSPNNNNDNKDTEQKSNGQPIVATGNINGGTVPNNTTIAAQGTAINSENKTIDKSFYQNSVIVASLPDKVTPIDRITEGRGLTEISLRKVTAIGKVTDGNDEYAQEIQVGALANARILNPMDVLKPSLLSTSFYDDHIIMPRQKEKKAKWRLNIFGLPVADLVSYHYVKERILQTEKQTAANLGGGVAVGYKKNKLEIETGLTYLDKKYDLPNVEVITGSFLRGDYTTQKPQNLRLSIVSIPLSMNYAVKETNRWRFYARIGAAFNTILRSKEDEFVQTSNATSSTNTSPKPPINVAIYEGNPYPKGILEGGLSFTRLVGSSGTSNEYKVNKGLKGNSYLTANAGLGVEYRLTTKTDIYLQPTFDYHYSKRGIGALNDRINSFSVQGGVKTKLK